MAEWTEEEFEALVEKVREPFEDGAQWGDLPEVLRVALDAVQDLDDLAKVEKRDGAIRLGREVLAEKLAILLDEHDMPWVPDALEKKWVDPWLLEGALWAYDEFAPALFTWVVDGVKGRLRVK
jgi:hypothetical protein